VCETYHSPSSIVKVKIAWNSTYTSPYVFHMYVSTKITLPYSTKALVPLGYLQRERERERERGREKEREGESIGGWVDFSLGEYVADFLLNLP
jgi:hypothetical protein